MSRWDGRWSSEGLISAEIMDGISSAAGAVDAALPGWAWTTLVGLALLAWWIVAVRRRLSAASVPEIRVAGPQEHGDADRRDHEHRPEDSLS